MRPIFWRPRSGLSKTAPFQEFIEQHRPLYQTTVARMQTLLDKEAHVEWFDAYFGQRPQASFTVALGIAQWGRELWPHFQAADGHEELYCILGVWQTDKQGLPEFTGDALPTVIHEFCHSYANPLVERHSPNSKCQAMPFLSRLPGGCVPRLIATDRRC